MEKINGVPVVERGERKLSEALTAWVDRSPDHWKTMDSGLRWSLTEHWDGVGVLWGAGDGPLLTDLLMDDRREGMHPCSFARDVAAWRKVQKGLYRLYVDGCPAWASYHFTAMRNVLFYNLGAAPLVEFMRDVEQRVRNGTLYTAKEHEESTADVLRLSFYQEYDNYIPYGYEDAVWNQFQRMGPPCVECSRIDIDDALQAVGLERCEYCNEWAPQEELEGYGMCLPCQD